MSSPSSLKDPVSEAPRAPLTSAQARRLLLTNLPRIRRLVEILCRRQSMAAHEVDDTVSEILLKLVEQDYRVLKLYSGRSKLSSYLTSIIQNHLCDVRDRKWGKWRPSKAALRHGTVAVELELLLRDGFSLDESVEALIRNHGVKAMPADLFRLAEKLPPRSTRRFESEDALRRQPVDGEIEDRLLRRAARQRARMAHRLLARAMDELTAAERWILCDRYLDGRTIAAIARRRGLDQKRLYRSHERCLARLRGKLQVAGLSRRVVTEIISQGALSSIEHQPILNGRRLRTGMMERGR